MIDGEINTVMTEKGFGFIRPADGGPDVFFHLSSLNVDIEQVTAGASVRYELDQQAAKARACKVIVNGVTPRTGSSDRRSSGPSRAGGRPSEGRRDSGRSGGPQRGGPGRDNRNRNDGRSSRPARGRDDRRSAPVAVEHGFVTKLYRKESRGYISSVKHGPEFIFEARSVRGDKRYSELDVGDYVEFVIAKYPLPDLPHQVAAIQIRVVPRQVRIPDAVPMTGHHPKARRRKPSWRGQK